MGKEDYEWLRKAAYEQKKSLGEIVRAIISEAKRKEVKKTKKK